MPLLNSFQPVWAATLVDLLSAESLGQTEHGELVFVRETNYACFFTWDGAAWVRQGNTINSTGLPMSITAGVLSVDTTGFATTAGLAGKAAFINYYNAAGALSPSVKRWIAVVTPSTSTGLSIDISSAGFTTVLNAQVIAVRNTTTATSSPNVSIKSVSTTALVVNITEGNAAQVTILGSSVLLGAATVFAATSGLTLYVCVDGL